MIKWNVITDNTFNKVWKISCPTCNINQVNSILWYKKQCHKCETKAVASEAIEFAEWIRIKDFQTASKNNWIGLDLREYTTEELFEQFKKK